MSEFFATPSLKATCSVFRHFDAVHPTIYGDADRWTATIVQPVLRPPRRLRPAPSAPLRSLIATLVASLYFLGRLIRHEYAFHRAAWKRDGRPNAAP